MPLVPIEDDSIQQPQSSGKLVPVSEDQIDTPAHAMSYSDQVLGRMRAVGKVIPFSDELEAGANAIGEKGAGLVSGFLKGQDQSDELPQSKGMSLGDLYSRNVKNINSEQKTYDTAHPIESSIETAAGFALSAPLQEALGAYNGAKGLVSAENLARGAATGALYGAGDNEDRTSGSLKGGALGAIIPLGLAGTGKVLSATGNVLGKVGNVGYKLIKGGDPVEALGQYLGKDGLAQAESILKDENGSILDVPQAQGLGKEIARGSGEEGDALNTKAIQDFTKNRIEVSPESQGSSGRLQEESKKTFIDPYFQDLQDQLNEQKGLEITGYNEIHSNKMLQNTKEINALKNEPEVQQAIQDASSIFRADDKKVPTLNKGITFEFGDEVKQQLDKRARAAYKAGDDAKGDIYSAWASKWRSTLDDINPLYKDVRAISQPIQEVKSMQSGVNPITNKVQKSEISKLFNDTNITPDYVAQKVQKYSPWQKSQAKISLGEDLVKRFGNKEIGIKDFSPEQVQKMRTILGNDSQINQFLDAVNREKMYQDTFKTIGQNNLQAVGNSQGTEGIPISKSGIFSKAVQWAGNRMKGLDKEGRSQLATIFTNRQKALDAVAQLKANQSKQSLLNDMVDKQFLGQIMDFSNRTITRSATTPNAKR